MTIHRSRVEIESILDAFAIRKENPPLVSGGFLYGAFYTFSFRMRSISGFDIMSHMTSKGIVGGTVHAIPADWRKAILAAPAARAVWDDITPLARNEWICWVTSGKKAETRTIRIKKGISKLKGGMRRPCCWAGCPHR